MSKATLDAADIAARLDQYLEVEFTFIHTEQLSDVLAGMPRDQQDFILDWTRRAAATNTELAFQFANRMKNWERGAPAQRRTTAKNAKKRAADRKAWLQESGDLAEVS